MLYKDNKTMDTPHIEIIFNTRFDYHISDDNCMIVKMSY